LRQARHHRAIGGNQHIDNFVVGDPRLLRLHPGDEAPDLVAEIDFVSTRHAIDLSRAGEQIGNRFGP